MLMRKTAAEQGHGAEAHIRVLPGALQLRDGLFEHAGIKQALTSSKRSCRSVGLRSTRLRASLMSEPLRAPLSSSSRAR